MRAGSFFQWVHVGGRAPLQPPGRIAAPAALATHVHDRLFERRGTSFVEESTLQASMRTGGVLALRGLLTRCGLPAFDDVVAVTVGTQHGKEVPCGSPSEAVSSMAHMGVRGKSAT